MGAVYVSSALDLAVLILRPARHWIRGSWRFLHSFEVIVTSRQLFRIQAGRKSTVCSVIFLVTFFTARLPTFSCTYALFSVFSSLFYIPPSPALSCLPFLSSSSLTCCYCHVSLPLIPVILIRVSVTSSPGSQAPPRLASGQLSSTDIEWRERLPATHECGGS